MIQKFSGDLEAIMHYLWSDQRVDRLIQRDWDSLSAMVDRQANHVSSAIESFCRLLREHNEPDIVRFLDSLSDEIFDCLLVELARELHFLKQNEGVVLH